VRVAERELRVAVVGELGARADVPGHAGERGGLVPPVEVVERGRARAAILSRVFIFLQRGEAIGVRIGQRAQDDDIHDPSGSPAGPLGGEGNHGAECVMRPIASEKRSL
jgi:hypothetical protein